MSKKKILFINQEISPYVPDSAMAVMGRELPTAIQKSGYEIRVFMPKWGVINERRCQLHEVLRLSGMNIIINETDHPLIIKVASIASTRVQVYFIDNEDYFTRPKTEKDELGADYPDNGERAIFFARGVLETVKKLRWTPDIIHCQGWISGVVPFYVKKAYNDEPQFAAAKVVTTLSSERLTNDLGANFKQCVAFKGAKAGLLGKYDDKFGFLELGKLAIDYSDGVIFGEGNACEELTVYARESGLPLQVYRDDDYAGASESLYERLVL